MNMIHIKCPKFEKLCDEYTRKQMLGKSGKNPASVRSIEVEVEEEEDFPLFSKEEIENISRVKLKTDISKVAKMLYEKGVFPKVHSFVNQMRKKKINQRAILHALLSCHRNKPKGSWSYCLKVAEKEDGDYNAKDYQKTHPKDA